LNRVRCESGGGRLSGVGARGCSEGGHPASVIAGAMLLC
jgi:hypothetical protein